MAKKISISNSLLLNMIVMGLLALGLVQYFWISSEYERFDRETEKMRSEYIDSQKAVVQEQVNNVIDYMDYMKSLTESRLRDNIRQRVYEACAIAENIYKEHHSRHDRAEMEKMVKDALRPIRFNNGRGYYFAGRSDGVEQLFADKPELEGKNLINMKDPEGKLVIQDMIEIVTTKGEDFYEYRWTKPNSHGAHFLKIAFVKYFEPFDWFVGTGEYVDDVQSDIQTEILNWVSEINFGEEGYIFLANYEGLLLAHGAQPELVGQNLWALEDVNGVKITQEMRRAVNNPAGSFITYAWQRPHLSSVSQKLSFVRGFEAWGWMVCAGVYVDALEAAIAGKRVELEKQVNAGIFQIVLIFIGITLFVLYAALSMSNRICKAINMFSHFFHRAARESAKIDPTELPYTDFDNLAESANLMVDQRNHNEERLLQANKRIEETNRSLAASVEKANLLAQEAMNANRAKSDFLANMSHEIRTPMNAILGFSHVLSQEKLDESQLKYVEMISEAGQNLLAIINDILDISKIEAGKMKIEMIEFCPGEIINSVVTLMQPMAEDKGLEFKVIHKSALPGTIHSDPIRLRQCLLNLLNNAIKFTERGFVKLSVNFYEDDDDTWLEFVVADSGIGIATDKQEEIFAPFSQADTSTTRRFGGTGLGLAITRQLVDFLGGSIRLNSVLNQGSEFNLSIPCSEGKNSAGLPGYVEQDVNSDIMVDVTD